MAAAPPQTAPPQLPPPQPASSPTPLSWEGEKMFNIYILDYCSKRGFHNTARELRNEADIPLDSNPPINARQGLLFEWWSVFWVLFTAKANGYGSEEALLYTQHQTSQLSMRQANQRMQASHGQGLAPGQQPQPGMPHQPPPPMGRLANGIAPRPGMMAFMPNGSISNGVGPNQGSMQPGGPSSFPMSGAQQPNGIPGPPGAPSSQGQNFQPMLPGQRPSMGGSMPPQQPPQQPGQQRASNGPFQSPNMSNSPQNPPGQQPNPHQPPHSQPPMGQLSGPSPNLQHLNRGGMLPPNQGMNPMNPQQGPPGQPGNAPPSQYQQRSPSRAATPSQGQGAMMQPSPSLANRQPPGGGQMLSGGLTENNINQQILSIPTITMSQIKQELGIENKDLSTFTTLDKQRIIGRWKMLQQNKPPMAGTPDGVTAGPSNPMMQPQNQQQRNNPQQRNPQQPQQRAKRSSTSPGEEHESLPRTESSPPDRKRLRPSPSEQPAIPNMSFNPQPHPQPGGPQIMMGPQGGQGVMVMRGPQGIGINGAGQQPNQPPMGSGMNMGGMGMGGPMGVPHMGGPMNPQMNHPGNLMQNQMQAREQAMRHQQAMLPKGPPQPGVMGNMPGNAGSPPSTDPSFNIGGPGFGPRMGQKTMMPPPSPAMNGPPKDQNGSNVLAKNPSQNPSIPVNHSSPRNPPPNTGTNNAGQTPNANGTGPPTPAPVNPQNPTQGPPGQNQGPNLGITGQNMAPSPSSILGGPPPMNTSSMSNQPSLSTDMPGASIFSTDFIQSVASSLDEFDPGIFRPDGDINFERDFGQWFNPDDVTSLEMK